jgi:hypothetical protein
MLYRVHIAMNAVENHRPSISHLQTLSHNVVNGFLFAMTSLVMYLYVNYYAFMYLIDVMYLTVAMSLPEKS